MRSIETPILYRVYNTQSGKGYYFLTEKDATEAYQYLGVFLYNWETVYNFFQVYDSFEEFKNLNDMDKKRAALEKLTPEERTLLGLPSNL